MNSHQHHHSHDQSLMGHGAAAVFLRRFWIVTFLLVPLVLLHPKVSALASLPIFSLGKWLSFIIATVIFGFATIFFQHAWHEIKARRYGMMTLVSTAVGAGYIFSVVSTFVAALQVEFYLEISTLVWVLLFGHYLEAKSSGAAGNALQEVAKLLPKQAHKLVAGVETDVEVSLLVSGDQVLVKPGEKVPADGEVVSGSANVDEALISGESKPVEKKPGASVVAGSICLDGSLTIRLTRVGANSTVGQIQKLIQEAGKTKPRSQQLADRASAWLTLVAGVVALLTLFVWTLFIGQTFVFAITLAITVLVIACPHALGLAIPTVTTITTTLAVKNGIFIKDLSKIETIKKADYVVFDKTGTLTKGEFGVTQVVPATGYSARELLEVTASLEAHSSHIIGQSILKYARAQKIRPKEISDFKNLAGQGVSGKIGAEKYFVGNATLIKSINFDYKVPDNISGTMVLVATANKFLGHLILADAIKESAREAVIALHELGVKVAMLTGDNEQVAKGVSQALSIDTYFANVLPEDKYQHIRTLQAEGNVVVMVGDGVNDAPALTQANVGVAIGAGTDVAVEAGDMVLTRNDPGDVVRLLKLSRRVYRKMIQNLVWALGYNVVAIPAAAGAFAAWGIFLRPEIGALLMSLSTVIVVVNAMSLKKVRL